MDGLTTAMLGVVIAQQIHLAYKVGKIEERLKNLEKKLKSR